MLLSASISSFRLGVLYQLWSFSTLFIIPLKLGFSWFKLVINPLTLKGLHSRVVRALKCMAEGVLSRIQSLAKFLIYDKSVEANRELR